MLYVENGPIGNLPEPGSLYVYVYVCILMNYCMSVFMPLCFAFRYSLLVICVCSVSSDLKALYKSVYYYYYYFYYYYYSRVLFFMANTFCCCCCLNIGTY